MDPVKSRIAHTTNRVQRAIPQPVIRSLIEVVSKELREQCTCGKFVVMHQYSARDHLRYVRCPSCGRKHALCDRDDTIRPIGKV